MKISHISKLNKKQIESEIDKIIEESAQDDVHIQTIINQALIAITSYDLALFEQLFSGSVNSLGLKKTYVMVIYPLLVRTGLMWAKDDLLPSQEHFLSNLIRQKLFSAINALPLPENHDQTWILFLNEEEDHEIGLLFAHYVLRQFGKHVIYLGARVPFSNLISVIKQCNPTHVYSFFVRNHFQEELEELLSKLTTDFKDCKICISGADETVQKVATGKNVHRIGTIDSLIEIINTP